MNPNRACPGAPNRYSFRLWSMVTQPKSMATVVVVLSVVLPGTSIPAAASVISASVVSGMISEIAPTAVVLPTPKPPATTIFTGIGGLGRGAVAVDASGERTKSIDHSQDGFRVMGGVHIGRVYVEMTGRAQVADKDLGNAQVQP